MEVDVGGADAFPVAGVRGGSASGDDLAQCGDAVRSGEAPDADRLDESSRPIHLAYAVRSDRAHEHPSVEGVFDEPLVSQEAEGLAHRVA